MAKMRSESVSAGTVSFRPMTAESAERLGEALALIDPWARYHYTSKMLSQFLSAKEEDAPRFEIVCDEALAGAISVRKTWLRGPYLQFIGILPEFQKRGIGSVALSWFEAGARQDKARNIWVVASDFNPGALAFYERFGFVPVAKLDGLVEDGAGEILFRKRLVTG